MCLVKAQLSTENGDVQLHDRNRSPAHQLAEQMKYDQNTVY